MADVEAKRITIRVPISTWRALRDLQTNGRIDSIQRAAVDGMDLLLQRLHSSSEGTPQDATAQARDRVLKALVRERPLRDWEGLHAQRSADSAGREQGVERP